MRPRSVACVRIWKTVWVMWAPRWRPHSLSASRHAPCSHTIPSVPASQPCVAQYAPGQHASAIRQCKCKRSVAVQAIQDPEDFIAACEATWRPDVLCEGGDVAGAGGGVAPSSPAGAFLRRCRLAFESTPFEVCKKIAVSIGCCLCFTCCCQCDYYALCDFNSSQHKVRCNSCASVWRVQPQASCAHAGSRAHADQHHGLFGSVRA